MTATGSVAPAGAGTTTPRPELSHVFDLHVDVGVTHEAGPGPYGVRMIAVASGGSFAGPGAAGEGLAGQVLPGGGDWLLAGADGVARLDIRNTLLTDAGAVVHLAAHGVLELTPDVMAVVGGGDTPTGFADQYFVTTPRLETGDPDLGWLNRTVFVAFGRMLPGPRIEYRVCRAAYG